MASKELSTADLESFRPLSNITRSDSGYTDTGYSSRGSSINTPTSGQSSYTALGISDKFFDDLNDETPLSTLPEGDEAVTPKSGLEAQGLSASAGLDIDTDVCSIQIDQFGVETIPIFVEEMQKILDRQASENKSNSASGARASIKDTFIDKDKIDRLPEPIKEFADVILLKFLIYNEYDPKTDQKRTDFTPPPMSIYGDTITLKNIILTLIYNCLGDEVVAEIKKIDDSEWYECIGDLGYEPEQGKGGKKGKKRKNKTRKRGGMPPKVETFGQKMKRYTFSALNFLGMVCTSLYDILIVVSIVVSFYYGVQMFIDSYESLKPIRMELIEPLKASLTNTTYAELLSESDKELIALDDMSLQYIGETPDDPYGMRNIIDVGSHVVLISLGSLAQIFGSSSEFIHLSTLAALGMNDGSQKLDAIILEGMDSIFNSCFYDITTPQAISLARTTLRTLRIDQPSRELIKRIIDSKEAEYELHLSSIPPSPDKLAADAKEIAEATVSATEESVGLWSRTVNSVSGFVGTAKETVASAAAKGKSKVNELGTALKVATTALDRGNCMKTEFREIYDDNRRKYEEFMAGIRKQSNRVTTAISYSRTEAWTGWALIGFSLYMLSYLRNRGKDQRIDDRLAAIEAERRGRGRGEDEQLAIGNVDEGNAAGVLALGNGQLAIGNGDEGNAAGVLALGNGQLAIGNGDEGNALRAPARAQALAQGFRQIGNDNNSNSSSSSSASNSNSNPSGSGVQRRDDNTKYGDQNFGSLNYKPSSSMFNSSSATTSNASSATTSNSNSAAAAPPRSTTPKKQLLARRKAEEKDQGNSGGRRTRRRSRQTKKRRMRVKRRQTRKLRRNTKRRRM
jgi:hypothetical protein